MKKTNYHSVNMLPYLVGLFLFQSSLALSIGPFHANLFQLLSLVCAAVYSVQSRVLPILVAVGVFLIFQLVTVVLINPDVVDGHGFYNRIISYFVYLAPPLILSVMFYRFSYLSNSFVTGITHSAYVMIILGVTQWFVYKLSGIDIFPYDIFYGGEGRSAFIVLEGVNQSLRLTALSGEPKTFGMFLALTFAVVLYWDLKLNKKIKSYLLIMCFILIIGTASTSALVCVFVTLLFYFIVPRKRYVFYVSSMIFLFFLVFFVFSIAGLINYTIAAVDIDNLGKGFIYDRVLNRINGLEDYDYLSLNVLKLHPWYLSFGGIFPFFHIVNSDSVSLPWWMTMDTIFVPKAGFLTLVSIFGMPVTLVLYFAYLFFIVGKSFMLSDREFVLLCLVLPLLVLLRAYLLVPSVILVFALIGQRLNLSKVSSP